MLKNISLLGDSRAFDTYYTNEHYGQRYGYHQTFPHLWRRAALDMEPSQYDVVHIPDHFRSGTIQNNILRLALTNPSVVVVLDGIWESLLNKGHFIQFVEKSLKGVPKGKSSEIEFSFSEAKLVELFKKNQLPVSPNEFRERARCIVSYFRRRKRQVVWMTLPVPPASYVGSTYHAGNYKPILGWHECLTALNDAVVPIVIRYGGHVFDLTREMEAVGGASLALIDQWHFSPAYHQHIAKEMHSLARRLLPGTPGDEHISNQYMLDAPEARSDDVVLYEGDLAGELEALSKLSETQILVYPEELVKTSNPIGKERAEFERQELR